jgi:ubiquinone/menaquinone biosynthesis C-methylase UbiE
MSSDHEALVVKVQAETWNRWTKVLNLTARFRYPHGSPLRKMVAELRSMKVRRAAGQRVLDIGFGHGSLLFWFKPPSGVYGIDLSPLAIATAKEQAKHGGYKEFDFRMPPKEDSVKIDYSDSYFDIVLNSHTIEHVYDDVKLMGEMFRVLKPGGKLFLVTPHDAMHFNTMLNPEDRRNPKFPDQTFHVWLYNAETIAFIAESVGFRIVKAEKFDAVMEQRMRWPRVIQLLHAAAAAVWPYSWSEALDRRAIHLGYRCRQVALVATKPF